VFTNTGSTIGAYSPVFSKMDFDLCLKVDVREDGNSVNGIAGFLITDRKPKVTIDPESVAEGTNPVWANLFSNASETVIGKIGTQGGNTVQLTVVAVSESVSYGDRSGIRTAQISLSVERANVSDTPGSEVQLKFS
jgi:hypothetical protein